MYFNKKTVVVLFLIASFLFVFAKEEHSDHDKHDEVSENQMNSIKENDDHGDHDDHDGHGEEEGEHEEGVIKLSRKEIQEFGLVIEKATNGAISNNVELNGEIVMNEENITHISARFGGEIKSVLVRQGQYVKQGDVLAKIQNSTNLTTYSILASRSGYIFYKDAAIGEVVDTGKRLFQLIDFSTVWAKFGVYQKDMAKIKRGQTIKVVDPFSGKSTSGKITYVSPVMEEESRTVTVRTTLKNYKNSWKPGVFVTGLVATESLDVPLRVPRSAVHNVEGKQVVFIQDQDGFEPQPVILGHENDEFVQVISGIEKGTSIVSQNGFILKSELGKSEMDDDHDH